MLTTNTGLVLQFPADATELFLLDAGNTELFHLFVMPDMMLGETPVLFNEDIQCKSQHGKAEEHYGKDKDIHEHLNNKEF